MEQSICSVTGCSNLPALQWKVQNVRKMSKEKNEKELKKLMRILSSNYLKLNMNL